MKYDLSPKFDTRQSFYGKAVVESGENSETLYSYNTKVAEITKVSEDDVQVVLFNVPKLFSRTTTRHIKEFLKQNGLKADSVEQIKRDYELVEV
jgi:hypothetical protein